MLLLIRRSQVRAQVEEPPDLTLKFFMRLGVSSFLGQVSLLSCGLAGGALGLFLADASVPGSVGSVWGWIKLKTTMREILFLCTRIAQYLFDLRVSPGPCVLQRVRGRFRAFGQ